MKLTIEANTEEKKDLIFLAGMGQLFKSFIEALHTPDEQSYPEESADDTPSLEPNASEDEPQGEAEPESAPAPESETPAEKPKRKRRSKAEMEAEKANAVAEATEQTNQSKGQASEEGGPDTANEEQPVVAEVEMPLAEPKPQKALTMEMWKDILTAKRIDLKLITPTGETAGAENANLRPQFNEFIYEICSPYGADKPSKLTDEQRFNFVNEKFLKVQYDPAKGFYCGEPAPKEPAF